MWGLFSRRPPAQRPDSSFGTFKLPDGSPFHLSIETDGRDLYHSSVAAGHTFDDTWRLIRDLVRRGDMLFDLGANIGTITIPAAVLGADVHAFELLQANVNHLARAVKQNRLHNVTVVHGAVSDVDGATASAGHSAWGVVEKNAAGSIPRIAIDTYVQEKAITRVDLIKIDVEGSEFDALNGMRGLLNRDHPDIILECNAACCQHFNHSCRDLLCFLETFGYDLYRIHGARICPWKSEQVQEIICADYCATVKPAAEIAARTKREIAALSDSEIIAAINEQDKFSDLHKQYILAVQDQLPSSLQVSQLIERWSALADPQMLAQLRRGAGIATS